MKREEGYKEPEGAWSREEEGDIIILRSEPAGRHR